MPSQSLPRYISILGGRLIDPANGIDQRSDLHITDGRVAAIGPAPNGFVADLQLDAEGLILCPGLVDLCARLREPGQEQKASIASETAAAAAAGVTSLCCPPDTNPPIDTPAVARLIMEHAESVGRARVFPAGALTQRLRGEQISEMAALQRAGCPILSHGAQPMANTRVVRRALEYASTYGLTTMLPPVDAQLSEGGLVHEGRIATRLGLPGIPEAAETVAVARDLALAEQTGARIHFRGLSTARATTMVAEAQARGIPVTADVAAHQLILTEEAIQGFDANALVLPPLRTRADRDALREALADGTISAVCSDHQPHEPDAKLNPLPQAEPGISALETLLPLMLALVEEGVLDLSTALAALTWRPAEILGQPLGRLEIGAPADVCVFDPEARWTPSAETLRSQGRNTPFLDVELRGRVRYTVLAGRLVFEADLAD